MIKEAKKEKGTDDFLGKVVIKLKVLNYLIFVSSVFAQRSLSSLVTIFYPHTTGAPLY